MIKVTVSKMKDNIGQPVPEKTDEEVFEYFGDEDLNEFANKVNAKVFEMSEDRAADQVWIYYRHPTKSNSRHIISKSIRHLVDKNIIGSRILADLNEVLKKDE